MKITKMMTFPLVSVLVFVSLAHFLVDLNSSIWPVYKTMKHFDLAIAGVMYAISVIIGECSQLYFGTLIDKGYKRRLLVLGMACTSVSFLFPYIPGYFPLFIALLIMGIGSAAFHPTVASILGSIEGPKRAVALGIFQMCGSLGTGAGQIIFVSVYQWTYGHTAVLLVPTVLFICIAYRCTMVKSTPKVSREPISIGIITTFFATRPLRNLYLTQVLTQTTLWATIFLLPDMLLAKGYSSGEALGGGNLIFFLGSALGCAPAGCCKFWFSSSKIICFSLAVSGLLFYSMVFTNLSFICMGVILFALGALLGSILPLAIDLGTHFVPERKGAITSYLLGLVWMVSESVGIGGVSLLTKIFTHDPVLYALTVVGAALFGALYFAFTLIRYEQEHYTL